ncbi:MAG: hypothetical protein HYZ73_06660, partial [Elusimicrobia bacterium]|nr:hypothetical protein [Elusimicrobiota bacterium]
ESLAVPLIQDVPVLAVGDRLLGDPDEVKQSPSAEATTLFTEAEQSVLLTVAVEPTEVGKLVLAREKGILSVGLRPIGETAILSPMPVQLSSLFLLPSTLPPLHETTHPRKGRSSLSRSQSGPSPLPGAVRSLERQLEQVLRQLP